MLRNEEEKKKKMKNCLEILDTLGIEYWTEPSGWHKCKCGTHHDTSPSLRIAPDGSYWRCMVCGDDGGKGDAIALYRWFDPTATFSQAVAAVDGETNKDPFLATLARLMAHKEQGDADIGPHLFARCLRSGLLTLEQLDDVLASDDPTTTMILMLDEKRRLM